MRTLLLIGAICGALAHGALAAKQPVEIKKGSTVVVKVPLQLWHPESASFSMGTPIYTIDADAVNTPDWQATGLPFFGHFVVSKIFEFKPLYKLKYTDVELRNDKAWVKIRFQAGADISKGFEAMTYSGTWTDFEKSDNFKNVVFGRVAARIFDGQLSAIPDATKLALLRIAGTGLATVASETYKGKLYVTFAFPISGTVYNSLKLNESSRVATVINNRLAMLKSLAVIAESAGVDGVKLQESVLYRDFVSDQQNKSDSLQVYAPLRAITQFSSADLTNQQFVDLCTVIVNDNRVQVVLSSAA